MKSASTDDRTDALKQKLKSSNCHSFTKVMYVDDDGDEVKLDDATYPIRIKKYGEKPKYANVNYAPAAAECDFMVINKGGIYSPKNTASANYDILKKNRVVKIYDGKWLRELTAETTTTLDLGDAITFYTEILYNSDLSANTIAIDELNSDGNTDDYFQDTYYLLDANNYGSFTYAPDGYFVIKVDLEEQFDHLITKFTVTANGTQGQIYYKTGNDDDEMSIAASLSDWTSAGATTNGDTEVTLNIDRARYLWISVHWHAYDWDTAFAVTGLTYSTQTHIEWVLQGTFYLDDPDFQDKQSPGISMVHCTGRNAWKKALETEISLSDLSGGVALDDLIEDICDLVNIEYDDSIADLSAYGDRTLADGYGDVEKVDKFFTDIMQIIGKDYRMYIDDDNVLYVQARPTDYLADWVFNFKRYLTADQKEVSEKQLQRFTIYNTQGVLGDAELLDEDTFLAGGDQTITWAGMASAKYYTYTVNAGDATITNVEFNNESAVFTINGSWINITVAVYGSFYDSGEPDYHGEAVNYENLENAEGFRTRQLNPLVISSAECKTIAENFIDEYGDPAYEIIVKDAYTMPLVEINDQVLLVSEDFFEDSLYEIKSIEYVAESETNKKSVFVLNDTGRNWSDQGDLTYDRNLYGGSANAEYDTGLIYDANFAIGIQESDISASKYYHNTAIG